MTIINYEKCYLIVFFGRRFAQLNWSRVSLLDIITCHRNGNNTPDVNFSFGLTKTFDLFRFWPELKFELVVPAGIKKFTC